MSECQQQVIVPRTPAVSVVVPVYRAARYLRSAIDSILGQSFSDFELLLVFDRSGDGTEEILKYYGEADARVRVIENTGKKQLAAALNFGLGNARGEFIARMDADDIATPDRLAAQLDFMSRHTEISLCGTGAEIIDANGETIDRFAPVTGNERIKIQAEYSSPLFHPTWMMRQKLVQSLGGYRDMAYAEDYDFQLRALDAGFKLDNLPITGIRYRRNPSHRARLANHKAGNYVYAMHRRRQRGLPDGFDPAILAAVVSPTSWTATEKLGQRWVEASFGMTDKGNPVAPLVLGAGLLLAPASAQFAWRRLTSSVALKVHDITRPTA